MHSVQRIWTGFGVRPPYDLRMVMRGLFLQRNRATPEHRGLQFSNASRKDKGSSSSSSSIGHATCGRPPLLWMSVRGGVNPGISRCNKHGGDDRAVVSQTTTRHASVGCGMRVVPPHGDRSTGGWPINTVWVCCCCCRLAGVAPANSMGLTSRVFFMRESVGGTTKCADLLNDALQT